MKLSLKKISPTGIQNRGPLKLRVSVLSMSYPNPLSFFKVTSVSVFIEFSPCDCQSILGFSQTFKSGLTSNIDDLFRGNDICNKKNVYLIFADSFSGKWQSVALITHLVRTIRGDTKSTPC